jgi:SAM-dependent methyltransferase
VILFVDVLHHTDDPGRLVQEAARVARRCVVIKDHLCDGVFARETLLLMDWVGNRGHDVALPYNYLSRRTWDTVFAEAGLACHGWRDALGLYPAPFTFVFDRRLHFIANLVPEAA